VELGYLGQWFDSKLAVDARVHHDEVQDIIFQTRPVALPPSVDNADGVARDFKSAGDVTLSGFETQIKFTPGRGLRLIGNYSYLDLDVKHFTGATGLRPGDFEALTRAMPKHNFGLLAIGRFNEHLQGSAGYYRVGGAHWAGGDALPHTTKLDLRLAYEFKIGANRAEWQFVAQDVYDDYLELEQDNLRDMRTYLNLSVQF
jgi:iron complex outermembrane recepter protein